jgi:hypothetical protein
VNDLQGHAKPLKQPLSKVSAHVTEDGCNTAKSDRHNSLLPIVGVQAYAYDYSGTCGFGSSSSSTSDSGSKQVDTKAASTAEQ